MDSGYSSLTDIAALLCRGLAFRDYGGEFAISINHRGNTASAYLIFNNSTIYVHRATVLTGRNCYLDGAAAIGYALPERLEDRQPDGPIQYILFFPRLRNGPKRKKENNRPWPL